MPKDVDDNTPTTTPVSFLRHTFKTKLIPHFLCRFLRLGDVWATYWASVGGVRQACVNLLLCLALSLLTHCSKVKGKWFYSDKLNIVLQKPSCLTWTATWKCAHITPFLASLHLTCLKSLKGLLPILVVNVSVCPPQEHWGPHWVS